MKRRVEDQEAAAEGSQPEADRAAGAITREQLTRLDQLGWRAKKERARLLAEITKHGKDH